LRLDQRCQALLVLVIKLLGRASCAVLATRRAIAGGFSPEWFSFMTAGPDTKVSPVAVLL
jgi:hypothetical protein